MKLSNRLSFGKAGLVGAILAIIFFLSVLILGLIQPGYNHIKETISVLVDGKYGWIQTINFVILIMSAIFIGLGMKKNIIKDKNILTTTTFWICLIELAAIEAFPANKKFSSNEANFWALSTIGKIHYGATFILMITITVLALSIVRCMKKLSEWKDLVIYSYLALSFNFIFGSIWFYLNENGLLFELRGLFQKIIVTNFLVWLVIVGFRLWRLEKKA